jgi:hypothetical protein
MRRRADARVSLTQNGAIAQLGERVLCKHEVVGSIPSGSTRRFDRRNIVLKGNEFRCKLLRKFRRVIEHCEEETHPILIDLDAFIAKGLRLFG